MDRDSTIIVNGRTLGAHRGGYDPFTFEITEALALGGTQEMVVSVWDPTDAGSQPRGKQVLKPGVIMYTANTMNPRDARGSLPPDRRGSVHRHRSG